MDNYDYEDVAYDAAMDAQADSDEQEQECTCSNGCMDCLGLSWRDFL
jgi:hypothetical protein